MTKTHLFLCGLRGSGKTNVGEVLSQSLSMPAFDLDKIVESDAGMSIREIFADGGEMIFRDFETVALQTVARGPKAVISLGGGAVLRVKNREMIKESGRVVWLTASPETLADRVQADQTTVESRPALTDESPLSEMQTMLQERRSVYEEIADHQVDTEGKTIESVAEEIQTWFEALSTEY